MHLHKCRCSQEHLRMILQSLRALCLAPGGPRSIWNSLGAPVRSAGVTGMYGCGFRTDLHFADVQRNHMHIRTAPTKAPTHLRHHDLHTYTLRTPPHPHMQQCTKILHRIPQKEKKPRHIQTIRLEHLRPLWTRDGPTLQTCARR